MKLSCIVAISENDVIGADGDLPWRLPADLQRFRRLTMGSPLIMGRKTYESIGRPLPGRHSIVLTRQSGYEAPGAAESSESLDVTNSFDTGLELVSDREEVFVIGGEALFKLAIPRADRLLVTRVHAEVAGDVHFPASWLAGWHETERERHRADAKNEFDYSFITYERD